MTVRPILQAILPVALLAPHRLAGLSLAALASSLGAGLVQAAPAVQQLEVGQQKTWSLERPIQRAAIQQRAQETDVIGAGGKQPAAAGEEFRVRGGLERVDGSGGDAAAGTGAAPPPTGMST